MPLTLLTKIKIILMPFALGLLMFAFYGFKWSEFYSMMSLTFFIMFPYFVGVLSIVYGDEEKIGKLKYQIFHPWKILGLVLLFTMLFAWEGWACWIMLFPYLALFSSLGGTVAGYFLMKESMNGTKMNVALMVFLPLVISPIESQLVYEPKVVETKNSIIIEASEPDKIWNNITNVYTIKKSEDSSILTTLLAFPRPLEATLDKLAIGGYRKAIFTKGLVFNENVTQYEDKKRMFFTIKANTYNIPSTTFDEHLLIGGDYFNMLDGEYRLEKIGNNKYKVILTSHFQVSTSFNWYAGLLGNMIMDDIQTNILKIVKQRS